MWAGAPGPQSLKVQLRQAEVDLITRALREASGDRAVAAARLGISRSSIYAKIEQYGVGKDDPGLSSNLEGSSRLLDSPRSR